MGQVHTAPPPAQSLGLDFWALWGASKVTTVCTTVCSPHRRALHRVGGHLEGVRRHRPGFRRSAAAALGGLWQARMPTRAPHTSVSTEEQGRTTQALERPSQPFRPHRDLMTWGPCRVPRSQSVNITCCAPSQNHGACCSEGPPSSCALLQSHEICVPRSSERYPPCRDRFVQPHDMVCATS